MPITIKPPIEYEFDLELSDKELGNESGDPSRVTIKQAREGEHLLRSNLWKKFEQRMDLDGGFGVQREVSPGEVKRKEVFLTMTDCNLTVQMPKPKKVVKKKAKDEPAKDEPEFENVPLFKFPLIEADFNTAWAALPPILANEIHAKVLEVNLTWASEGESG